MNSSTNKCYRLATATGLAAVLAAIAIPVAFAHPVVEGDARRTRSMRPRWRRACRAADRRSPDTLDAAAAMAADQGVLSDVRSPDTLDAAFAVRQGS